MSDASGSAAQSAASTDPRDREEVRALIIETAQRLQARDGLDGVTFTAVAREAHIPRAKIYAHFSSRQNLVSELEAAVPADPPPAEATAEPAPEEVLPEEKSDGSVAEEKPRYDEIMRAQAEALQQISQQVIVPKPRRRDEVDAAFSRMDARITVAEQSIAALEQRAGERLKKLSTDTGNLSTTLQELRERVGKFEERQQAALAELRLEVHNFVLATADEPGPRAPAFVPAEPVPVTGKGPEPGEENSEASEPLRMQGYLHSARQAAINAAATAPVPKRPRSPLVRFLSRKRWTLLAVAALLVAWFDIYVFAHYQPAEGGYVRADALVPAAPAKPKYASSPRSQLVRGLRYLNGTGVPINVDKAAVWLKRSANGGNAVAQNFVGVLYQTGTGVPADMVAAMQWYESAARQGNLKAMTNLGKLYAGGWKEGTDFVKAAEWFSRAATYGEVDAQFNLAILFERGAGVPHNVSNAYKWYVIAAARNDAHAQERAGMLAARLTPEELQAAQAEAAAFKSAPVNPAANDVPRLTQTAAR